MKRAYHFARGISDGQLTVDVLRSCIHTPKPVILEIGANDGQHSRWFADLFPQGRIHCFEPDPRATARWRAMIGHRPNVTLHELAIADRDGTATFHQSDGAGGRHYDASGSIRCPKNHLLVNPDITFAQNLQIPTQRLDSWCEREHVEEVDFIWMDVQGAELDVIRGGRRTLARTRTIYTEYNALELYEGQVGLAGILKELGHFSIFRLYPEDVLLRNQRCS